MPLPTTLGKYQLEREVGRGGFAVVYQAHDPTLDRRVAIKVPHTWLLADPRFVERFRREARLAANLTHPHIVTIHEIGEAGGTPFIAMEWLEGMPLDQWLAAVRPPPQVALQALVGVGAALDMAHAKGVVHRDIKPSNIMMAAGRGGVLTDFGIARLLQQATQTTTGVMGTPTYMAPEQLKGEPASAATDMYALGVLLYEVLAGRPPFQAETPTAVAYMHATQAPPDPRSINPALPKPTATLLLQALAKDARQRPVGAEKLIRVLLAGLRAEAAAKVALAQPRRRQLWQAAASALFLILVAAVLVWALSREDPSEAPTMARVTQAVETLQARAIAESEPPTATLTPTETITIVAAAEPVITASGTPTATPIASQPLSPTATATPTSSPSPSPSPTTVAIIPGNGLGHIVFSSGRDGNPELYVMDARGGSLLRLTRSPGNDWSPAWSPDGRQIAFTSSRDATAAGMHNIYLMHADGSNVRRLTYNQAWDEYPAWSPDGSRIAFVTTADNNAEIFVVSAYGGDTQRVTFTPWDERNPTWSPDGNLLAFSSNQTGVWQIYLMNADGSSTRQISRMTADSFKPAWSPDGGRIAFHSDQNGNRDIYIMNADGSNLRRLTSEPSKDEHPAWSPDGSAIVFSSNRGGYTDDLYVVWADGRQPTLLFASTVDDGSPAWGP